MPVDKKSFVMYLDYEEHISLLDDEECGKLFKALFVYAKGEEVTTLSGAAKMAFSFIRSQMDRDNEKYLNVIEKRKEAGKKGGRPKKEETFSSEDVPTTSLENEKAKKANGFSEKQTKAKKADNDNVTVNDNDIKIKAATCAGEDVPTTSPINSDVPTTGDMNTNEELFNKIASLYFNITGRMCNANDCIAITRVTEQTQDLELIKTIMTDLHNRYKPSYAGDKIKAFKYFVDAILEAVEKQKKAADVKYVDDDRLNKTFNKFLKYREQMGNPVYDTELLLNNLRTLDANIDNQVLILENSISNGWKGIFALKKQQEQPQSKSRFNNCEQRSFDPAKMRELERQMLKKDLEKMGVERT